LHIGVLGFAHRGFSRIVTTFAHEPLAEHSCQGCGKCARACPTGALSVKESLKTAGCSH
jgi:predicted molibdopterin-dependent oxidoreductase YjgC